MKKIILYLLLAFICYTANSQETKLIGTWEGELLNSSDDVIWKVRIKVLSANSAELYLYDDKKSTYLNYLTDSRFAGSKRTISFKATGNYGVLIANYNNSGNDGQSVYNLQYNEKEDDVSTIWTNLNNPLSGSLFGTALLVSDKVKVYNSFNITIGGKSFENLGIEKVELGEKLTKVTLKIKNITKELYNGTIHEPGHNTAFYLTDASRSKQYKLTGSNYVLPLQLSIDVGKSKSVVLYFEAMPLNTKLFNMLEGGPVQSTNLWKFYDISLEH
jgi:hypothetical protein